MVQMRVENYHFRIRVFCKFNMKYYLYLTHVLIPTVSFLENVCVVNARARVSFVYAA